MDMIPPDTRRSFVNKISVYLERQRRIPQADAHQTAVRLEEASYQRSSDLSGYHDQIRDQLRSLQNRLPEEGPAQHIVDYFKKIHEFRDWLSEAKSFAPAKVEYYKNFKLSPQLLDSVEHLISEEFDASKTYIKKNLERSMKLAEETLGPLQKLIGSSSNASQELKQTKKETRTIGLDQTLDQYAEYIKNTPMKERQSTWNRIVKRSERLV